MLAQRLAAALRDAAVTLAVRSWFERGVGSMESSAEDTHLDVLPDSAVAAIGNRAIEKTILQLIGS